MKKIKSNNSSLNESDIAKLINRMKIVFPTIDEVSQIVQEEIKFLPTKEEFYSRMDKLSGEIEKVRQEQVLHSDQHQKINDRFERVNKHFGISTAD